MFIIKCFIELAAIDYRPDDLEVWVGRFKHFHVSILFILVRPLSVLFNVYLGVSLLG